MKSTLFITKTCWRGIDYRAQVDQFDRRLAGGLFHGKSNLPNARGLTPAFTMATPLPTPNPFAIAAQAEAQIAYNYCLDLEDRHGEVEQIGKLAVLVCSRLLGQALLEAPTEEGRNILAAEIIGCDIRRDRQMQDLALLYKDNFIRICRCNTKAILDPLTHIPQFIVARVQRRPLALTPLARFSTPESATLRICFGIQQGTPRTPTLPLGEA